MSTIHNDLLGCEQTFVDTGKYRSRIIEKGEGTPLILMHGGGGHRSPPGGAELHRPPVQRPRQDWRDGFERQVWIELAPGPSEVREHDHPRTLLRKLANGLGRAANAGVIAYFAVGHGHIEIGPDQNAAAGYGDIVEGGKIGHGRMEPFCLISEQGLYYPKTGAAQPPATYQASLPGTPLKGPVRLAVIQPP